MLLTEYNEAEVMELFMRAVVTVLFFNLMI